MTTTSNKFPIKVPPLPEVPFVSLCTPTFNRRPFIPFIIQCIESQDYPKDKIEWIIVDDGTDKIEDTVSHLPYVKYFYYPEQMTLGKKRNLMHTKCSGDVLLYIDDDDYYPPDRISHAIDKLKSNPSFLIVGSTILYMYFEHIKQIYKCGPYGTNHATAATFAFRKELLETCSYDDTAALAEEKHFLKNHTIPIFQLDPMKTILVFSHVHNTFNKKVLLEKPSPIVVKTDLAVSAFIKDDALRQFYTTDINNILALYKQGEVENKPAVVQQLKVIMDDYHFTIKMQESTIFKEFVQKIEMKAGHHLKQFEEQKRLNNMLLTRIRDLNNTIAQLNQKPK